MKNLFTIILKFFRFLRCKFTDRRTREKEHIAKILNGHYETLGQEEVLEILERYDTWMLRRILLVDKATPEANLLRLRLIKEKKYNEYRAGWVEEPLIGDVFFMRGVFTDPFPSTHDMDDWALLTRITDILTLSGIPANSPVNFYIHIKNHWVNHEMITGIIEFDVFSDVPLDEKYYI